MWGKRTASALGDFEQLVRRRRRGRARLGRLLENLVFGITATDPATLAAVAVTLAVVALAASLVPAFRALRLDPLKVLRAE